MLIQTTALVSSQHLLMFTFEVSDIDYFVSLRILLIHLSVFP